jgi:hypothetical protein
MNEERARAVAIRIIDEFEELLAEKGIMVPSKDREGGEEEACLYGTEYYALEDAVVGVVRGECGAGYAKAKPRRRPMKGRRQRVIPTEALDLFLEEGRASAPVACMGAT